MSQLVFTNAKVLFGGCDLSADLNQVDCAVGAKMLDDSAFGDTYESNHAGLITTSIDVSGFWNAALTTNPAGADNTLFPAVGVDDKLFSVFPNGYTEGTTSDRGLAMLCTIASYAPINGKHGDLLGLKLKAQSRSIPLRPSALKDGTATMILATGNGTKFQLGAVGATQHLYAGLHALEHQGTSPTLDVTIQSDPDASAGGESTRITFAQVTTAIGPSAQYATPVDGPITDTYWRATYTIGGSATPGWRFLVWMCIC